jgi:protein FAM50
MCSDQEARRKKLAKLEKKRKNKLSFAFNEEGSDDTSEAATPSANESSAKPSRSASVLEIDDDTTSAKRKRLKLGKDPTVDTSFLPDREREEQERIANGVKHEQWLKQQEEIKTETVEIQFAYFDGLSHLGSVSMKKGEPVFNLIDKAKKFFSAIRDVTTDKLMFAKDDIIIPQELSLYYFAAHNVKGKYGPLFEFYDPQAPNRPRNKDDVLALLDFADESLDSQRLLRGSMRRIINIFTRVHDGNYMIQKKMYCLIH